MPPPSENELEIARRIAIRAVGRNPNCRTRQDICAAAIARALADSRETAAKDCDAIAKKYSGGTFNDSSREVRAAEECAATIRGE